MTKELQKNIDLARFRDFIDELDADGNELAELLRPFLEAWRNDLVKNCCGMALPRHSANIEGRADAG